MGKVDLHSNPKFWRTDRQTDRCSLPHVLLAWCRMPLLDGCNPHLINGFQFWKKHCRGRNSGMGIENTWRVQQKTIKFHRKRGCEKGGRSDRVKTKMAEMK